MKEIGGYLEFEQLVQNEYHTNMLRLNSANAALILAIKEKQIKKINLPYYLCGSVFDACSKTDVEIAFYNIDKELKPVFDRQLDDGEYLYIVNYYGLFTNYELEEYKSKYKNIIMDNVQAFFQKPIEGVITLYSCRKFFGIPDGAYLQLDYDIKNLSEYEVVFNRVEHLIGRTELSASEFYGSYTKNENKFEEFVVRRMSKFSENVLGAIPYESVIASRKNNFDLYNQYFASINRLDLNKNIIAPFCYPLYVENGSELRKMLISNKVYIPTLWPNIYESQAFEFDLMNNLIQLPCDQRYNEEDVEYICNLIRGVDINE